MGLDFSLYKKRKDMTVDEFWDLAEMNYPDFEKEYELAYGRKSWELVKMLATGEDVSRGYGILDKDKWDKLIKAMEPIAKFGKLNEIAEAYEKERFRDKAPYPEVVFTDHEKRFINDYVMWHNRTFSEEPTLGYEFSLGYMIDFWNAQDIVRNYLDDPDYDVIMIISY